ncbi:acetate--CoA ligase family protein [Yinghuangia seranimata]|uniref:acetate--CoA ligase family protein n=1 Tax=Yinghuangia seranimata TaxID=408067 RepID=UPI00248CE82F|nr:acetate--CoA ligase family protein [Yinghuangia seranimata]MDI2127176.1 acetate--CoA ligase family protein [Yinghuangia seranimata]
MGCGAPGDVDGHADRTELDGKAALGAARDARDGGLPEAAPADGSDRRDGSPARGDLAAASTWRPPSRTNGSTSPGPGSSATVALVGAGGPSRGRVVVPEHEVKGLLAGLGVRVPRGSVVPIVGGDDGLGGLVGAARGLRGPLVLKAYGSGLVHKSDVGAVRLGLGAGGLVTAAREMAARVAAAGLEPGGWLVEEQEAAGAELIVGVVRGPFGPAVLLGHGGVLAETLDQVVVRLHPLGGPDGTASLIAALPGLDALRGARGTDPADLDALAELLAAVDRVPEAVAAAYPGLELDEFECNPVIVGKDGAVAVDARLVLRPSARSDAEAEPTDFGPLFAPRTVAVAGASTGKTTFGNRFLAAYRAFGRTEGLYAVHRSAREVDGVPAVASVADIPGGADYLLVAVPAAATPQLVAGAGQHARFVHVVSGGFGEAGEDRLEQDLLAAARAAGVRLLGPNCLGVYAPSGGQTFQLGVPTEPGTIGVVSQSGGLAGDIAGAGTRRGLRFSALVTIGNAVDVGAGELVEHFAGDPATRVIGMYLEGVGADGERLARAVLRATAAGKPVVALVGGLSRQGARAVASHTGALAGGERMWEALSAASGLTVVRTLEDFLAVLAVFQRHPEAAFDAAAAPRSGVLVVGPGGGASVLAADACDRAGLAVRPLPERAAAPLRARGFGAGTSLANPVEIPLGPATGPDAFARVLKPVLAQTAYADALLHVNVQSFYGYGDGGVAPLLELLGSLGALPANGARIGLVARNLACAPPDDAERVAAACGAAGVPLFRDFDEAATAIAAVQRLHAVARATPIADIDMRATTGCSSRRLGTVRRHDREPPPYTRPFDDPEP